jgi:hypothetical protein
VDEALEQVKNEGRSLATDYSKLQNIEEHFDAKKKLISKKQTWRGWEILLP